MTTATTPHANWRAGHRIYWHGLGPRPPYHTEPEVGTVVRDVKPGDRRCLVQWDRPGAEPTWVDRDAVATTTLLCQCPYCASVRRCACTDHDGGVVCMVHPERTCPKCQQNDRFTTRCQRHSERAHVRALYRERRAAVRGPMGLVNFGETP